MSRSSMPSSEHPIVSTLGTRGAVSHWVRRQRDPHWRRSTRLVRCGLDLPAVAHAPGVWAVAMVRNESDIIATTVNHLLEQDVAHVLVVDNGSTDETLDVLRGLDDDRVHIGHDHTQGYYQAAKMTQLAAWAGRHGADWVVPFDADELWTARGATLVTT